MHVVTRGGDRELTMPELAQVASERATPSATRRELIANLHFRLVEVATMFILPLLAVSLAVPPKRSASALGVFLSIVLIVLILMHSGKDAGLSGAFGVGSGTGPLGGGSLVERNLNRWTIGFAVLFVINTIVLLKLG